MHRRVLNLLTAVSLLLCVACVTLCVDSYTGRRFRLERSVGSHRRLVITSWHGWFYCGLLSSWPRFDHSRWGEAYEHDYVVARCFGKLAKSLDSGTTYVEAFEAHYGPAVVATAILPGALIARAARRAARIKVGLCRACGYNLRATPGRCPECGTTAAA